MRAPKSLADTLHRAFITVPIHAGNRSRSISVRDLRTPSVCTPSPIIFCSKLSLQSQQHQRASSTMSSAAEEQPIIPGGSATEEPCNRTEGSQSASKEDEAVDPALPPLSAHEFRQYNRLAEHMDMFVCNMRSPADYPHVQTANIHLKA